VMNIYGICSTCRRTLLAKGRREGPWQWRSRAHFISLSNPRNTKDDTTADILAIGDVDNTKNGSPRLRRRNTRHKAPKAINARSVDLLESLFKEGRTPPPVDEASSQKATLLELYGHLETLKRLLSSRHEPIEGVWAFFISHLGPTAWNRDGIPISRPLAFKKVVSKLLHRVNNARKESYVTGTLPSSSEIMAIYTLMDMQHPGEWNAMLWDMIRRLCEQRLNYTQTQDLTTGVPLIPSAPPDFVDVAEDLLGAWQFLWKTYGQTGAGSFELVTSRTKKPKAKGVEKLGAKWRLDSEFLSLLPRYPLNHLRTMSSAALATFAILVQPPSLANSQEISKHPFMVAVAKILSTARADEAEMKGLLEHSQSETGILNSMGIDWPSVMKSVYRTNVPPKHEVQTKHQVSRPLAFRSALIHRELGWAMTERNLPKLDQLWEVIKSSAQAKTSEPYVDSSDSKVNQLYTAASDSKDQRILSRELYNHFILAYMGLRQPNRAINVWNFMIETSVHPTLSTWNAMLEGCKSSRSLSSVESVWAKLQAAGVKPDMACWTTRISGLVECGKPDLAIRALDEMGQIWLQAVKRQKITNPQEAGDIDGAVKPTIETINAAISGLLRRQNTGDAVNRILAWGGTLGIQPDIITFNTLLRSLVRNGPPEGVSALLSQMQKANIQADVATFTTLLEEMFKTAAAQIPEEQNEIVKNVFAEMEAAGIEANLHTYSKIIYSLLQLNPSDMTAVKAVMARMAAKGVEPSTYIYTILIKHHFSQETPDLEAVRLILERIRLSDTVMDHIFWDRVIEGYARVGDTTTALNILGRVDKPASRVGWPALQMVLMSLAENGEWDLARQVVRNAWTDRGGPPKPDERGVEGQHNFWRSVASLGLMGD
jgi:pentatricopeptide repeat protein